MSHSLRVAEISRKLARLVCAVYLLSAPAFAQGGGAGASGACSAEQAKQEFDQAMTVAVAAGKALIQAPSNDNADFQKKAKAAIAAGERYQACLKGTAATGNPNMPGAAGQASTTGGQAGPSTGGNNSPDTGNGSLASSLPDLTDDDIAKFVQSLDRSMNASPSGGSFKVGDMVTLDHTLSEVLTKNRLKFGKNFRMDSGVRMKYLTSDPLKGMQFTESLPSGLTVQGAEGTMPPGSLFFDFGAPLYFPNGGQWVNHNGTVFFTSLQPSGNRVFFRDSRAWFTDKQWHYLTTIDYDDHGHILGAKDTIYESFLNTPFPAQLSATELNPNGLRISVLLPDGTEHMMIQNPGLTGDLPYRVLRTWDTAGGEVQALSEGRISGATDWKSQAVRIVLDSAEKPATGPLINWGLSKPLSLQPQRVSTQSSLGGCLSSGLFSEGADSTRIDIKVDCPRGAPELKINPTESFTVGSLWPLSGSTMSSGTYSAAGLLNLDVVNPATDNRGDVMILTPGAAKVLQNSGQTITVPGIQIDPSTIVYPMPSTIKSVQIAGLQLTQLGSQGAKFSPIPQPRVKLGWVPLVPARSTIGTSLTASAPAAPGGTPAPSLEAEALKALTTGNHIPGIYNGGATAVAPANGTQSNQSGTTGGSGRTTAVPGTQTGGYLDLKLTNAQVQNVQPASSNGGEKPAETPSINFSKTAVNYPSNNPTSAPTSGGGAVSGTQDNSGSIRGTVTDPAQEPVENATVVAVNNATGQQMQTRTDPTGQYRFPSLPAGTYTVHYTATGLVTGAHQAKVEAGNVATANAKMSVSGVEPVEEGGATATTPATTMTTPGYQVSSTTASGLQTTTFSTLNGTVTVNVTDDVAASDTIYGTVTVQPKGNTPQEQEANRAALTANLAVQYANELIPLMSQTAQPNTPATSTAPTTFQVVIPATPSKSTGTVALVHSTGGVAIGGTLPSTVPTSTGHTDNVAIGGALPSAVPTSTGHLAIGSGETPSGSLTVLASTPTHIATTAPPAPSQITIPTGGQQGRYLSITEPCNGADPAGSVKIGETAVPVLAESPRKKVVQNTSTTLGPTQITDSESGRVTTVPFRNMGIRVSAPILNLRDFQTTIVTTTVVGGKGITKPFLVNLHVDTPTVIRSEGGPDENVEVPPSEVGPDGTWSTGRKITAIHQGGFGYTSTLHWDGVQFIPISRPAGETPGTPPSTSSPR